MKLKGLSMSSGRVIGLITTVSGLIVAIVGFGMYRSPHLDWEGLVTSFSEVYSILIYQANYFVEDPFAFIGLIVMAVGAVTFVRGVKMLLFVEDEHSQKEGETD